MTDILRHLVVALANVLKQVEDVVAIKRVLAGNKVISAKSGWLFSVKTDVSLPVQGAVA